MKKKKPVPASTEKPPVATSGAKSKIIPLPTSATDPKKPRVLTRAQVRKWLRSSPGDKPLMFAGGELRAPGGRRHWIPGLLDSLRGVTPEQVGAFVLSLLHIMERADVSAAALGKEGGPAWKLVEKAARDAGLTQGVGLLCGLLTPVRCLFPAESCAPLMLRACAELAEKKWKLPPGWDAFPPYVLGKALWNLMGMDAAPAPRPCDACAARKDGRKAAQKKRAAARKEAARKAALKAAAKKPKRFKGPAEVLKEMIMGPRSRRRK